MNNFTTDFLQPGEVIVRYGYVSEFSSGSLFDVLNTNEKRRADQFRSDDDRLRHITCRAVLKLLLARHLGIEVMDVQLQYSPNGKPMLPGISAIQFNVSHCRNIMLWGISNGNTIGVDVEHVDSEISAGALMSVCTEAELDEIQRVPGHLRQECFINCWTKKEALVKALGSRAGVLGATWADREIDRWFFQSIDLPDNYRAAVAIKGKVSHVGIYRLNGIHSSLQIAL